MSLRERLEDRGVPRAPAHIRARMEGARIALEAAIEKRTNVRIRLIGGCDIVTVHELECLLASLAEGT